MRISVSCSRADLAAFPTSSSSAVHRPSFGRGWTSRSYSKDVSPDRSTLRTVFRDIFRSLAISLIVLPLRKCSRRIRPIVSTVSIPPPPALIQSRQRISPIRWGSILDADPPAQRVKIARRITLWHIDRLQARCVFQGRGFQVRACGDELALMKQTHAHQLVRREPCFGGARRLCPVKKALGDASRS